jgi:alkylation response protein AidB-like acyl-CoA dehydrogenase
MAVANENNVQRGTTHSRSDSVDAIALILKQAGRSAEEVASLATLDDADRAAEVQFSGEPPTIVSLFGNVNAAEFEPGQFRPAPAVAATMSDCIEFLLERKKSGTLLDHSRMLFRDDVLSGVAARGFFGLAIPQAYGGSGAPLGVLGPLLRALTLIHPDLAVMFEVHNFLGPVTPLLDFGTEKQKQSFLPRMARGELLGSFALTEPGVGADPSRLSLTARRAGNTYLLSGVKWPITNVVYGGLCVLVLKIEGEGLPKGRDSGMLLFEVPKGDTPQFQMIRNDLTAFDYLWNARFRLSDFEVSSDRLLGPPGKGLAQAFSSLAKGRGGICVNSAAKIFKLMAQLIVDPETSTKTSSSETALTERTASGTSSTSTEQHRRGGWLSFRSTFGKPIGDSPRIQSWVGKATCHALASRVLGDVCFRLGANNVRDETMGMIAKVYATKALLDTAIHAYQIQGGRSVHRDQRRAWLRQGNDAGQLEVNSLIENYIGENMHEFTIATVYEGPNPVLADVGAPNAMTRGIRAKHLEPIGLAEAQGKSAMAAKVSFAWFLMKTSIGSWNPWVGTKTQISNAFPQKLIFVQRALRRNRVLGRRILWTIARYQRTFMDQSFLLGDEGGIFDQLCSSVASLVFALSLDQPHNEYLDVAAALDLEANLALRSRKASPQLHRLWAQVGSQLMRMDSRLYQDLIMDIEVSSIPLDPRFVERYV